MLDIAKRDARHSSAQEKFQLEFRRKLSGGCLRRTASATTAVLARGMTGPHGAHANGAHSEAITPNMAGGRQVPALLRILGHDSEISIGPLGQ